MTLSGYKAYQAFKYAVYALLAFNIVLFFARESAAIGHRFATGLSPGDLIEGFAATIDTSAWVILLLMFELETWVLDDRQLTPRVSRSLHALRAICYAFIVYAFYGYLTRLLFLLGATPLEGVSDPCSLVDGNWSYATGPDIYEVLTLSNCAAFSGADAFFQFRGLSAVVDAAGLTGILRLAAVDFGNSGVWLLVVALLEIDVRLQERGRLRGAVFALSTAIKGILYAALFAAAVYWGLKGDIVDFWDAFLWLVAFFFIEMNVFEWRRETPGEALSAA